MHRILAPLIVTALLGACSSSNGHVENGLGGYGGSWRGFAKGSESYAGPQTAAIAPVSDGRTEHRPYNQPLHTDIQQSIQRQLDRSGIFAGVVALETPNEGNEAEVIIEPQLVERAVLSSGMGLRVRVTEKTKHRVVLDKRYEGANRSDSLQAAIRALQEDLVVRYGR